MADQEEVKERNAYTYRVYVVKLKDDVRKQRRFAEKNPGQLPQKGCFYVGSTCLAPEQRFQQHLAGKKSCRFVRLFGQWLARRQYEKLPSYATRSEAEAAERAFAETLRSKGFGVWQN